MQGVLEEEGDDKQQPAQSSKACGTAWREIFRAQKEIQVSLSKDGDSDTHHGLPKKTLVNVK